MLCLAKGGDMMVAGFALDTYSRLQSIVDCWVANSQRSRGDSCAHWRALI